MKKFRDFLFRSRLTFWLCYASINLLLLMGLHQLFHMKGDWFYLVSLALLAPTFYLLIRGHRRD